MQEEIFEQLLLRIFNFLCMIYIFTDWICYFVLSSWYFPLILVILQFILFFQEVQRDEDYNLSETDANEAWCFICRESGKLICCENCSKTFHLSCVGIKKLPSGSWECPYCRDENKDTCCACELPTKDAEIKVTCSLCYRTMHFDCIGIPLRQLVDCPMNRNYFLDGETLKMLQSLNEKDEPEIA